MFDPLRRLLAVRSGLFVCGALTQLFSHVSYPVIPVAQTGLSALFDAKGRLLASRDARFSKVDGFLFELPLGSRDGPALAGATSP